MTTKKKRNGIQNKCPNCYLCLKGHSICLIHDEELTLQIRHPDSTSKQFLQLFIIFVFVRVQFLTISYFPPRLGYAIKYYEDRPLEEN